MDINLELITKLLERDGLIPFIHYGKRKFKDEQGEHFTLDDVLVKFARETKMNKYEITDILRGVPISSRGKEQATDTKIDDECEPIYYLIEKNRYYVKDIRNGRWVFYNKQDITMYLRSLGFNSSITDGETVSQIERLLLKYQRDNYVEDVCVLAGYSEGIYEFQHGRTLITSSPVYIEPEAGEFPLLDRLFSEMFGNKQKNYFYSWLKVGMENLRQGPDYSIRGQALFLVGPPNACKSLVQQIITNILSGRACNPHLYFMGETTFNADLFGAEHMILDDKSGKNWDERGQYSMRLKEYIANTLFQRHEKGMNPKMYSPKWRITVSLNNGPESMKVIPLITEGLEDKISILSVSKPDLSDVIPQDVMRNDKALVGMLCNELPQFIYHLLNVHQLNGLSSNRFGIKSYHDPEIYRAVTSNPSHENVFEALTMLLESEGGKSYTGKCTQILMDMAKYKIPVDNSFRSAASLGRRLTEMSKDTTYRDYISYHELINTKTWTFELKKPEPISVENIKAHKEPSDPEWDDYIKDMTLATPIICSSVP